MTEHRIPILTTAALTVLLDYDWPGNVRELRHRIQRAMDPATAVSQISAHMLIPEPSLREEQGDRIATLAEARDRAERRHIEEAVRQTRGEIAKAATMLVISRTMLWEKMRKLHIH
ncbi:MAG TPA: helix-turn-helix domain-containing protein [Acetobacteraceae bacterium]|nr:helix-turn-helix domain-containing protein [Acetobacteraceae bacterium]